MSAITLSLKNFRCWENKTFTFQDNCIILISGISGKGKSTILNAILYVITGNMKNVTTFGKEKANMEAVLSIRDLVITRGKNPTRFTVKQGMRVYEEDQAQSIINSYFGSDFKHISYIDQDNSNSFVYLSPEAKMTFLRNLLLANEPIDDIKDKVKAKMDTCKKELIAEEATIATSLSFLKRFSTTKTSVKSVKEPLHLRITQTPLALNAPISIRQKKIGSNLSPNALLLKKSIKHIRKTLYVSPNWLRSQTNWLFMTLTALPMNMIGFLPKKKERRHVPNTAKIARSI